MDFQFWFTIILILLMTAALLKEWAEPDLIIFSTLLLLILGGVISTQEAFIGFSNAGMLTVGFLFVVAAAMQRTGTFNHVGNILLGKKGPISVKLLRFLFPVAGISAFFNNTPVVAMLIPAVRLWAKRNDYPVSKFLIPLSYAAILGGTCTLIGTSTTLVVHGLMLENGMEGMGFFEITKIGLPVAAIGLSLVALLGHRLLPSRTEPMAQLGEQTREFVVAVRVTDAYRNIGLTLEEAGLRHLKGLYLFQIERQGSTITPVPPTMRIRLGDRLFFTGLPETILELQRTPGLNVIKDEAFDLRHYDSDSFGTFEVVISPNSPLVGKNVRESNFRAHYNAVILAIHRSGGRIQKKIGDIVLRSGDTLLLLAPNDFFTRYYHSRDFYLVTKSITTPSKPKWYTFFSLGILIAMIVIMATGVLPILVAVSLAAVILVASRCISPEDAWTSVDWSVLLIIASAFGISKGLQNSGVAHFLAEKLIIGLGIFGPLGLLAGIYFITSFYTEIITNNAAAALVFPITLAMTRQAGIDDPRPFLIALALAASASFATPIGYQTNLMVYGPGGYRFRDFLKIGIPMNITIGLIAIITIYFVYLHGLPQ
jgi:di/tricarboxylate transporter